MNWVNAEIENPQLSETYLCRCLSEGFTPIYTCLRWSVVSSRWIGVQPMMRVTHWCEIEPPKDHSRHYYERDK